MNNHIQHDSAHQPDKSHENGELKNENNVHKTVKNPTIEDKPEVDETENDEEKVISLEESDNDTDDASDDPKPVKTVVLTPSEELTPGVKSRQKVEVDEEAPKPEHKHTRRVPKVETQKIPDDFDRITPHKPDTAVLSTRNTLRRKIDTGNLNSPQVAPSDNREIILVIRGMVERLVLRDNKRVVLGRTDIKSRAVPDIDLTPYGALDRGVSREHSTLHIEGEHLYVTDLDSTNGTYLAGKRLTPYVPSILRKGDELLLGRLPVQVLFR